MDGIHPNRKKDKFNPYRLSIENGNYYITFTDGQGKFQKQEISRELYLEFNIFELTDISQLNESDRHLTELDTEEDLIGHRIADLSEPVEDRVHRRMMYDKLHEAIAQLPNTQRRRLLLYFFGEYTYEQIAQMEGCSKRAVKFSVDIALRKLKGYF